MDILLNLPQQLALDIIRDWACVSLKDLSALDVAHSNRGEFLDLLANHQVSWNMATADNLTDISLSLDRPTMNFLYWMRTRNVQLSSLLLNCAHIEPWDVGGEGGLQSTVTRLLLTSSGDEKSTFYAFSMLTNMFPAVVELDFTHWNTLTDYHLHDILTSCADWRLRTLVLSYTNNISSSMLYTVLVSPICSQLQELSCVRGPRLDDAALWRLIEKRFNTLIKLNLDVFDDTLINVAAWCAINTKLESLTLRFSDSNIADAHALAAMATTIAKNCTHLHAVDLSNGAFSALMFFSFVKYCPNIKSLQFDRLFLEFGVLPNGKRYWEFFHEGADIVLIQSILQLIDTNMLTLRGANTLRCGGNFLAEFVDLIADKFGATLEEFHCDLDSVEYLQTTTLEHIFQKCPQLRSLTLFQTDGEALPLEVLKKLPDYCPRMKYLCFGSSSYYNRATCLDSLVLTVLKGYARLQTLEQVYLTDVNVTDNVLFEIVDRLPYVQEIGVEGTGISVETILKVIIDGKLKNAVILPSDDSDRGRICARLREMGLGHLQYKLWS